MASIQKRPDGVWRARYRDEAGKEHARHFPRKVDAQRWLDEVTTSVVTGRYVDPKAGRITFQAFYDKWSKRQLWAPSTVVNADQSVKSTHFAPVPIGSIRRSHIETWVKQMTADGRAPSTIKTRYSIVRSIFAGAVSDKIIPDNPTDGVILPRTRRAEAAMRIPTVDEVGKLLSHADSPRVSTRRGFRAFVAVCAFAGLRMGEAGGLQLGDIDFLRRKITVRRQLQRDGDTYAIRPPKYESEREVPIPDELVVVLSEHVAHFVQGRAPDAWLFTHDGVPLYDNTVTWRWRGTRRAAGLDHVRLHDLRHFYASGLIAQGCDVVTVQKALGHAKATTTLNTYSHLWPKAEDRTRAAASALMRSALGIPADSLRTSGT